MAISKVEVKIGDGSYANATYNSTTQKWVLSSAVAPGQTSYNQSGGYWPVLIRVTNTAGTVVVIDPSDASVGEALKLIVKETIKPTITFVSPTGGAYVTNNKQPITFTVLDEAGGSGINISSLVIKVDGTTVSSGIVTTAITNGYSVTYTPPSALADGSHIVLVDVSDNDGNAATQGSLSLTVDTVAPTLNITAPIDGLITNHNTVAYSGSTNDATSSPVTIAVKLNDVTQSPPTVSGGTFSGSLSGLADGDYTAVFTATDAAGKATSVTKTFTVDTYQPSVSSVSISPNPADTGATLLIELVVS